jgi:hypothetical protein
MKQAVTLSGGTLLGAERPYTIRPPDPQQPNSVTA